MAFPLLALATPIIKGVFGIIDQVVEDKDEANKIKAAISARQHELDMSELEGQIKIVLAEANGSWLQRNWRPLLMLIVIVIIANNYILVPYISMFTDKVAVLELPDGLWTLLVTGVGGYVVGRSGEKIAKNLKGD